MPVRSVRRIWWERHGLPEWHGIQTRDVRIHGGGGGVGLADPPPPGQTTHLNKIKNNFLWGK